MITSTETRPTPNSLQRGHIQGHLVKLGDGNEWRIPAARPGELRQGDLPIPFIVVDGLLRRCPVLAARNQAWVERARVWERQFRAQQVTDSAQARAIALQVLAINYRLTPEVADFLNLFFGPDGDDVVLTVCLLHCVGANNE